MNIYVSNLNYSTNVESLQELFEGFGEVTSANIIKDRETGRSRGFGFVEMPNDNEGQKAIDELNESDFEGKTITVNVARPKTDRNDRRGGFNRNSGGFNRGGSGSNRGGGSGFNRGGGDGYNKRRY